MADRVRVFIGSSTEGRGVAEHLRGELEQNAEILAWHDMSGTVPNFVCRAV
jgi:hypothetical protein